MTKKEKRCYKNKYAPEDIQHNCMLYQYAQDNPNAISPIAWRQFINYATFPIEVIASITLGRIFQAHNIIADNNFAIPQRLGIMITPLLITKNKYLLELNDFFYDIFGLDFILNDLRTINSIINLFSRSPTHPREYQTTHTSPTQEEKGTSTENNNAKSEKKTSIKELIEQGASFLNFDEILNQKNIESNLQELEGTLQNIGEEIEDDLGLQR